MKPPSISPGSAASKAMDMYDNDGDGFIADAELEAAVELQAAMATLDEDSDGKVTKAEIANRIRAWQDSEVGVMSITCKVLLGNRPLPGAEVTFEPAEFLGDNIKAAVGVSDPLGDVSPAIPTENRPTPDFPFGVQFGLYRVKVSRKAGGKEMIPPKYNEETVFGQEISFQDPKVQSHRIIFQVETK